MEQVPTTASSAFTAVGLLKRVDWSKASLWVRYGRFSGLRVRVGKRRVPATYQKGFMGAEVEVSVTNTSRRPIRRPGRAADVLKRLRCPGGVLRAWRTERPLSSATLDPGAQLHWYVRGEKLSQLLTFLFHPPKKATGYEAIAVAMYARCLTGAGRIGMSPTFEFPTDVNAHWP